MTIRGPDILMNAMVIFVTLFTQSAACRVLQFCGSYWPWRWSRAPQHLATSWGSTAAEIRPDPIPFHRRRPARPSSTRRSGRAMRWVSAPACPACRSWSVPTGWATPRLPRASFGRRDFPSRVQPGPADRGHRPRLRVAGPAVQTGRSWGTSSSRRLPLIRQNTTLVTIFAGGNEVNTITAALGGGAGAAIRLATSINRWRRSAPTTPRFCKASAAGRRPPGSSS